jgi:hypothetical protein
MRDHLAHRRKVHGRYGRLIVGSLTGASFAGVRSQKKRLAKAICAAKAKMCRVNRGTEGACACQWYSGEAQAAHRTAVKINAELKGMDGN